MNSVHNEIARAIDNYRETVVALSHEIHERPELKFAEKFAAAKLADAADALGIRMERIQADGSNFPEKQVRTTPIVQRFPLASASGPIAGMVRLPGEIMEVQLDN